MHGSKKALKALVAAAAVAIPVGIAIPAQAYTSNGCTVTGVTPYANGDINANGVKLVDYDVNVSCTASALTSGSAGRSRSTLSRRACSSAWRMAPARSPAASRARIRARA